MKRNRQCEPMGRAVAPGRALGGGGCPHSSHGTTSTHPLQLGQVAIWGLYFSHGDTVCLFPLLARFTPSRLYNGGQMLGAAARNSVQPESHFTGLRGSNGQQGQGQAVLPGALQPQATGTVQRYTEHRPFKPNCTTVLRMAVGSCLGWPTCSVTSPHRG